MATVRIERLRAFEGRLRTWRVFVDGDEAAALGPGDRCELRVHPGGHLLEVRPGRPTRSGSLAFSVPAVGTADFECRPAAGLRLRPTVSLRERPSSQVFGTHPHDPPS